MEGCGGIQAREWSELFCMVVDEVGWIWLVVLEE
jgi:hypothetical protein